MTDHDKKHPAGTRKDLNKVKATAASATQRAKRGLKMCRYLCCRTPHANADDARGAAGKQMSQSAKRIAQPQPTNAQRFAQERTLAACRRACRNAVRRIPMRDKGSGRKMVARQRSIVTKRNPFVFFGGSAT